MMKSRKNVLALALLVAACANAPQNDDKLQRFVVDMQQQHPDLLRLTVHAMRGSGGPTVIASTKTERIGTPSDPEDERAMQNGQTVVLVEGPNLDVTVPIQVEKGGKAKACVGVTLAPAEKKSRDDQVARAESIARAVERAMAK